MNVYLLDTNIASLLGARMGENNQNIFDKLASLADDDVVMVSIVTLYEAQYGLKNSKNAQQQKEIADNIALIRKYFEVIPLDMRQMELYADLKVRYREHTGINKTSMKKNDLDLLIAASAMAEGATLVSLDRIFETLSDIAPDLKYDDWSH